MSAVVATSVAAAGAVGAAGATPAATKSQGPARSAAKASTAKSSTKAASKAAATDEIPSLDVATEAAEAADAKLEEAKGEVKNIKRDLKKAAKSRTKAMNQLEEAREDVEELLDVNEAAESEYESAEAVLSVMNDSAFIALDPARVAESDLAVTEVSIELSDPQAFVEEKRRDARQSAAMLAWARSTLDLAEDDKAAADRKIETLATRIGQAEDDLGEAKDQRAAAKTAEKNSDAVLVKATEAAEEAAERRRIAAERAEAAARVDRSMRGPSSSLEVTSPYGMRTHPITGVHKLHSGTDFGVGDGLARAALEGTIEAVTYDGAYGNMVTISHDTIDGDSVQTRYAHLSSATVSAGQEINTGDTVGNIGSTGYSTGAHLHFEVLVNGEFVDPMTWLNL